MDFSKETKFIALPQIKSLVIPEDESCPMKTSKSTVDGDKKQKGLYLFMMELKIKVSP